MSQSSAASFFLHVSLDPIIRSDPAPPWSALTHAWIRLASPPWAEANPASEATSISPSTAAEPLSVTRFALRFTESTDPFLVMVSACSRGRIDHSRRKTAE
jgi:hypothetical protein